MKCTTQVGVALAGGYLLGRTKKMKLALMLGGMAAGRQLSTNPGELLKVGANAVRSSPEVSKLVDQARVGLVGAGKAAAVAAASNRMESMTGRLSDRATSLGPGGAASDDDADDDDAAADEDSYDESDEDVDEADTDEAEDADTDDEADTDEADTDEADTDEADTDEADTDEADTDEADTDETDTDEAAETAKPRSRGRNSAPARPRKPQSERGKPTKRAPARNRAKATSRSGSRRGGDDG